MEVMTRKKIRDDRDETKKTRKKEPKNVNHFAIKPPRDGKKTALEREKKKVNKSSRNGGGTVLWK